MNSVAFLNRLLRPLKVDSLSALTPQQAQELVDALNAALQLGYAIMPDSRKRKSQSVYLPVPRTVTLTVSAGAKQIDSGLHDENGDPILTEDELVLLLDGVQVVSANHIGASIKIEGDPYWNRVAGENLLLNAYTGPDGEHEATIYSDVIVLDGQSIERMAGDPKLDTGEVLLHDDRLRRYAYGYGVGYHEGAYGVVRSDAYLRTPDRMVGRPLRYYLDHPGDRTEGAVESQGIIVLDPIPSVAHNVRFDAIMRPLSFGLDALTTAIELPLPDDLMQTVLLPLAYEQMMISDLWRDDGKIKHFSARANEARARLQALEPAIAVPHNSSGTPRGW